jgi:diguanylate cyclase (GGDEF)-like protein
VFVLALLALAGLGYLAWASDSHPLMIGLLVAIPLFAAIFLSAGLTGLVGVLVLAVAGALVWLTADGVYDSYLLPLAAVLVSVVVAVIAAFVSHRPAPESGAHADTNVDELPGSVEMRLQSPVDTDPMTGLLNRRGAIRSLGPRNSAADRVVAFLDCDLFRVVNETYGTDVGDEFLQAIAGRLRHSLPARDTVARWDGDEFLVAVSAEASSAMSALERVVAAINGHPIRTGAGPIEASMSVGAAVWLSGQDLEDVISRAGRALHTAKSDGRGQVVLDAERGAMPPDPIRPDADLQGSPLLDGGPSTSA